MCMVNLNIGMAREGNDFILVFRNCTPELEDIIKGLLTTMAKSAVTHDRSDNQQDTSAESKRPEITSGRYKGQTAKEALDRDGVSAIAELLTVSDESEDVMADISVALNGYPSVYFKDVDPDKYTEGWGVKEIRQFMEIFEPLVPQTWRNEIAVRYGAADYESAKKTMTAKTAVEMICSFIGYWKS